MTLSRLDLIYPRYSDVSKASIEDMDMELAYHFCMPFPGIFQLTLRYDRQRKKYDVLYLGFHPEDKKIMSGKWSVFKSFNHFEYAYNCFVYTVWNHINPIYQARRQLPLFGGVVL